MGGDGAREPESEDTAHYYDTRCPHAPLGIPPPIKCVVQNKAHMSSERHASLDEMRGEGATRPPGLKETGGAHPPLSLPSEHTPGQFGSERGVRMLPAVVE